MGQIEHQDVQFAERVSFREYLRELNERIRTLVQTVSVNRSQSLASQIAFHTAANGTFPTWIAQEGWIIDSITVRSTTNAGTVTPTINGVNVGGVPFAVTNAVVTHPVTTPNILTADDVFALTTAGLTGTATFMVNIRRQN